MLSKTNSSAVANRLYLRVQNGKLTSSRGDFSSVSGVVSKVDYKDHVDKNGNHYSNWHLLIDDADAGEYYDIAFANHSDCFGFLLSSLLSPTGLINIRKILTFDFMAYRRMDTKAVVSCAGKDIPIGERMPALVKIVADNSTTYDGSARHAWLLSAMDRVNHYINAYDTK